MSRSGEPLTQITRWHAQQDCESVFSLATLLFQFRDQGPGPFDVRESLIDIQFRHTPISEPRLGDGQTPLLDLDVLARQFKPFVERSNLNVRSGHIANQSDKDCIVVFNTGIQLGIRRLNLAAQPTPDVQLP